MSFNEELLITDIKQLEKGKDYMLQIYDKGISNINYNEFNTIFTFTTSSNFLTNKFINSKYELTLTTTNQVFPLNKGFYFHINCITNLLTNYSIKPIITTDLETYYYNALRCNIYELTNEYVLK